jgi:dTDP-4-amino-4,6-dideoxygalactose transaminase
MKTEWDYTTLAGADVELPFVPGYAEPVWHLFVIRSKRRDALKAHLEQQGISTVIHYPIPPHQQACYHNYENETLPIAEMLAGEVLSLPISSDLTTAEINHVAVTMLGFDLAS